MFRATNSSILTSTFLTVYAAFGTMHRQCCRPVPRLRWNFSSTVCHILYCLLKLVLSVASCTVCYILYCLLQLVVSVTSYTICYILYCPLHLVLSVTTCSFFCIFNVRYNLFCLLLVVLSVTTCSVTHRRLKMLVCLYNVTNVNVVTFRSAVSGHKPDIRKRGKVSTYYCVTDDIFYF